MSAIRLFILSSFARHGPMHGHRLRLEAERDHLTLWTDVSVGAVYGAMSRLASEGLLREAGQERDGNRPTRQLYEITDAGRALLADLRRRALTEVWFRHDPFDLGLTRTDPALLDELPAILAGRLAAVRAMLADARAAGDRAQVGPLGQWALRHTEYRLSAEVAYLTDLLGRADEVIAAERARRSPPDRPFPEAAPRA